MPEQVRIDKQKTGIKNDSGFIRIFLKMIPGLEPESKSSQYLESMYRIIIPAFVLLSSNVI